MGRCFPEIPEYLQKLIDANEPIDEIRLDHNGNWFHNDEPFVNERIIDFFVTTQLFSSQNSDISVCLSLSDKLTQSHSSPVFLQSR